MHFLGEELKEKSVLLRSFIITSNNQKNKSSEKTPENPITNFPSKENSNDIKGHVPPIKDYFTDFCIDGTATKSDNTEKEKQFEKKDQFKQKTLAESNTEREEHGIANEERSEIVIPQPILAHVHYRRGEKQRYHVNNRRFNDSRFEGSETLKQQEDKSAIFSLGRNRRSNVSLNFKSKKKPHNIIIHIGTNDASYEELNMMSSFMNSSNKSKI